MRGARAMTGWRWLAAGAGLAMAPALGGCVTAAGPPALSEEQVCLQHFENNPSEQARCRLDPVLRIRTATA